MNRSTSTATSVVPPLPPLPYSFFPSETKFLIVAGGTGGHVLPGISLAEHLPSAQVIFLTIDRSRNLPDLQNVPFPVVTYDSPLMPSRIFSVPSFFIRLFRAIWVAMKILRREKVAAVLCFGSYASFPAICGAILLRIPLYLFEQNVIPGKVILRMARFARRIFVNFPMAERFLDSKGLRWNSIRSDRVQVVGNPIRQTILQKILTQKDGASQMSRTDTPARKQLQKNTKKNTKKNAPKNVLSEVSHKVLVLGGSQGARQILQIVVNLLQKQMHSFPRWRAPIHWYLQCGNDFEATRKILDRKFHASLSDSRSGKTSGRHGSDASKGQLDPSSNKKGQSATFYIQSLPHESRSPDGSSASHTPHISHTIFLFDYQKNIHEYYADSELLICRAGAGVLSEALLFALPMIIIPLPNSVDQHQQVNAHWLEKNGMAKVLPILDTQSDGLEIIMEEMLDLKNLSTPGTPTQTNERMRAAMKKLSRPDAGQKIAEQLHQDLCR